MNVAIVGKNGLLGGALMRYANVSGWKDGENLLPLDLPDFDVTSRMFALETLHEFYPNVIINASGINLMDWLEKKPNTARTVHVQGTANLREAAKRSNALLVQISCAEVFGQTSQHSSATSSNESDDDSFLYCQDDNDKSNKENDNKENNNNEKIAKQPQNKINSIAFSENDFTPFTENCVPEPISIYAKTKLESERAAGETPRHLIVRTGVLFGKSGVNSGGNLVETLLHSLRRKEKMSVVHDIRTSYVWSEHLAKAIFAMIQQNCTGLYHVANRDSASPFEIAQEIVKLTGVRRDFHPIAAADYGFTAPRAAYSVLDTTKYHDLPNVPPLPTWREALKDYLASRSAM